MKHVLLLVLLLLSAAMLSTAATAQSLADVARKEEARRKAVKVPGKVYTNNDLKPDPSKRSSPEQPGATPTGPPLPPSGEAPVPGKPVPGAVPAQPVPVASKSEAYWKALITGARGALERSKVLADALQSRLNALTTDIVNRDDPAQRAQLELERKQALAELDRMKTEIAEQTKAIAEIEDDARKAGAPPGWLR